MFYYIIQSMTQMGKKTWKKVGIHYQKAQEKH